MFNTLKTFGAGQSWRRLCGVGLLLALTGCASSPPMHYYTLQAPASDAATAAPFEFALQAVRVPPQVDVAPLIIRQGETSLITLEGHQWSAPLALEWRGALSTALGHPHGGIDLARAGVTLPPDVPSLRVDVQRFDSEVGGRVHASGVWSLTQTEPAVSLSCPFGLHTAAGDAPADIVRAHQRLIAQLATQMAVTLTTLRSNGPLGCPH